MLGTRFGALRKCVTSSGWGRVMAASTCGSSTSAASPALSLRSVATAASAAASAA
jgi:hypothetical protein